MENLTHDYDCPHEGLVEMFQLLSELEKRHGKIIKVTANGPAGGNPCFMLSFPDYTTKAWFDKAYNNE